MAIGRRTAAASISDRCRRLLSVAFVLSAVVATILGAATARAAGDVFVLQDQTPIVSKPGVGGKILVWVDTGFPLTVRGIQGDWLKVSSSLLKLPAESLWVPAARVGKQPPGMFDVAYSDGGFTPAPHAAGYRLEIIGTESLRVRAACHMVEDGDKEFVDTVDETPVTLHLDGTAVDCTVRKLTAAGRIDVLLLGPDGRAVAAAGTFARHGKVRLRSDGSWGRAAGFALPTRFVVLKELPDVKSAPGVIIPPLGDPVPPFGQSPVPLQ